MNYVSFKCLKLALYGFIQNMRCLNGGWLVSECRTETNHVRLIQLVYELHKNCQH